ncbi:hypothetical protein N7478_012899 [Penicillium angulare]|uniref:uncharacterized protein n=1 Tax=Penicillium angulare TaxID=116970 RepID=UPI0025408C10|nr:uncharacterized protein N7478_012899 [Penicillium angulare]KAJ5256795.1 hypothetical protein N7478_012899 [Penicillium angulare]
MIWIYESSHRKLHKSRTRSSPQGTGQWHGSASEPSLSRCHDPLHPSVVETTRPSPDQEQTNVDIRDARETNLVRPGQAQLVDMIDAVERLRAQVEHAAITLSTQRDN